MAETVFMGMPKRLVGVTIDGRDIEVVEGSTILDACRRLQVDTPTLCQLDNLNPVNVCRVCVVELEGSRVLVPACSRKVEAGMKIATDSERVRHSRRLVLELLASACVYCGNCIGVCPTGALMFKSEHDMRTAGTWDESRQSVTETVCPYCGVGCVLELHVQDNSIVKVTSPMDHSVTAGHLCVKGRFGFQFVQRRRS